ncbi:MAG TPA: cupredoxin domain-containing protein [Longimicrobiales bacterium]
MLENKEVYAFVPSTITVQEGDTLRLRIYNPEDDEHTFVLPDLYLKLPPQAVTSGRWVARRAGIYPFACVVPAHLPMMRGEIVVLRRRE